MKKICALLLLLTIGIAYSSAYASNKWGLLENKHLKLDCWYRSNGQRYTCPDQYLIYKKDKISSLTGKNESELDNAIVDLLLWVNCDDGNHIDYVLLGEENKLVYSLRIETGERINGWMKLLKMNGNRVTTLDSFGIYRDYTIQ